MKIFLLNGTPPDYRFAECSVVGSWSKGGKPCKACQLTTQDLTEPLLVEWEPGSDVIGDFSWGGYTAVVKEEVKSFFERSHFECQFGIVKVVPFPERIKKSKIPQAPFPYTGPVLHWLRPTEFVELDEKQSCVNIRVDCQECGQKDYTFRRTGLVIKATALGNRKLFRIKQFGKSKATFVTEEVATQLTHAGFSNFHCHEAGVIV